MDVMSSLGKTKNSFNVLLKQIKLDYPAISFKPANNFRWSSESRTVFYDKSSKYAEWSLLHELGHMVNEHNRFLSDSALVRMEVQAWDTAIKLAGGYGFDIDEEYVQDCIDSYRNWQYTRSTCPQCALTGVERTNGQYICINCRESWKVTTNRFCRVYRKRLTVAV